jgi:NAD(P)-dependent dehydrogenase (short-subunit alcohol dehydrogenase family)
MRPLGRMHDKRVLVTGSGTGIGREIALECAREGASVALHYAHSDKGAVSAVAEICAAGGKAKAFKADLNSVGETRALAEQAIAFLGGLDVLVNNAGITANIPFEQVTPEQFDTLYQVNVRGQFFLTQAALPELVAAHGAVVNLTSIHAFEGYVEHSIYAGTKGAIVAYTRQLAIELAPKGVRVNAIAPGAVPVENHFKAAPGIDPAKAVQAGGKLIPCGFMGTPLDIAKVAVFLASADARYIVGQTLVVDGGTTSWMPFGEGFKAPMTTRFGKGYVPGL